MGGPDTDPSTAGSAGAIAWTTCTDIRRPDGQTAKPDPSLQCGRLAVPLDYAKPDGESLDIAVIRTRATGPGPRIGSLIFNFGGPGASGVDTLAQAAKVFGYPEHPLRPGQLRPARGGAQRRRQVRRPTRTWTSTPR